MTTLLFFILSTTPHFTCSFVSHHSFASFLIFHIFSLSSAARHTMHNITTPENDNEWMNNKFATAVMMAEQQSNFTLTNYDCDRTLFSQHDNNCLQHHVYQDRSTYHNEVPTSSIGYIDNRVSANVSPSIRSPFVRNHECHFLFLTLLFYLFFFFIFFRSI